MDLDKNGIFKYNQRKGIISPSYTCFPNNICQAWEILNNSENCWKNVSGYHLVFNRIPDKLTYFMRFEPMMQNIYKFYFPNEFKIWHNDSTRDQWLYSNNSYPPNELFKLMCLGFNMFINMNNGDDFKPKCTTKSLTIDEIIAEIQNGKPVVASFKLGELSHIMTIKGYENDKLIVYDTYDCSFLKDYDTLNYGKVIKFQDFIKLCKPVNNEKKFCICFL